MISSTSAVAPAIPAGTSILGIPSPSDSTASFADQLASAVHGGAAPTTITTAVRQNSDAQNVAAPAAAELPQYSFFQYMMGIPSTSDAPSGNDAASASTASAGGIPQSTVSNSSSADPGWLSPPYYTPPAAAFVSWEAPPGVINTTAAPETDLQNLAAQFINDPLQFVWGAVPATTPQEFVDNIVSYAQSRAATYPEASPEDYDPVATGTQYANLILDSIKKIQYDTIGSSPYASIYDAWVAGVNTFPGASGTAGAVS